MRTLNKNDFRTLKALYCDALELFENEEYRSALASINDILRRMEKTNTHTQMEAKAYILRAEIKLKLKSDPASDLKIAKTILEQINGDHNLELEIINLSAISEQRQDNL